MTRLERFKEENTGFSWCHDNWSDEDIMLTICCADEGYPEECEDISVAEPKKCYKCWRQEVIDNVA